MKRLLVTAISGCVGCIGLVVALGAEPIISRLSAQPKSLSAPLAPLPPGSDSLLQLSDRFETVAQRVLPAVVAIEAVKPLKNAGNGSGNKPKAMVETGSGVIVKLEGHPKYYILTSNHVITQAALEQITIQLADERVFKPTQIWADPETDIAFMAIEGAIDLPTAVMGNSDNARVGKIVLAMGNPFGLRQTVTHGIISARERGQVSLGNSIRIKDFLQTDAPINPGSSGGPLIDMNGEVIGINTAIASPSGSNSGVAFSVPINMVRAIMGQLLQYGTVRRGYLGAEFAQVFEPQEALRLGLNQVKGALVRSVYAGTPAHAADLKAGDVILQIDQTPIRTENHFINLVSTMPPGRTVRLEIWRNRTRITREAVIGDWNKAKENLRTE